ncbi:membrane hypothetical protein [uncultured Defluviicoccus sp.]|uniref:Uncharacterized protein n=1 Tax=metagenome TaxID=256318 RepID=A0A380TE09_9ZZZZ|nr:membrane hypothetical protein [uncultured Defluviicoccus sp.]
MMRVTYFDWMMILEAASLIAIGVATVAAGRGRPLILRGAGLAACASGVAFLVSALVPALVPATCVGADCVRPGPWNAIAPAARMLGVGFLAASAACGVVFAVKLTAGVHSGARATASSRAGPHAPDQP